MFLDDLFFAFIYTFFAEQSTVHRGEFSRGRGSGAVLLVLVSVDW